MVLTHASYYPGASHIANSKPVQDRAAVAQVVYGGGRKATVLLLADGHGSDVHYLSDVGAEMAISASVEALPDVLDILMKRIVRGVAVSRGVADDRCVSEFDRTPADPQCEAAMRMFFARINSLWASKVLCDWNSRPRMSNAASLFGVARAYGCTLLGAVRAEGFWFAFQLGDGACVALDAFFRPFVPVPPDSRCRMSQTTSMCVHDANDFRYAYGSDIPAALMLCSDGLADCFGSPSELASQFLAQIVRDTYSAGFAEVEEDIAASLPALSGRFTGDDMSIALWIDTEAFSPAHLSAMSPGLDRAVGGELSSALAEMAACEEAIDRISRQIAELDPGCDEAVRKESVLSTMYRRQSELAGIIENLKKDKHT